MLRISFDFNETSKTVSNVKVTELENKKSRGVVSTTTPETDACARPDLEVLDNKLQLSPIALQKLNARADDRISIQYVNAGIGNAVPVIGKAEVFTDRLDGNRVTLKGTVAFRGEKRATLLTFGSMFNLEEYKDDIWKLIPITESNDSNDFSEENSDAEALNDNAIEQEIEEITSSVNDDLPF